MNVKLTLNINKDIIDLAKSYARSKNQSLSSLVQDYLKFLAEKKQSEDIEISPTVKELSGVIRLNDNFDLKKEYRAYITEKY